MKPSQYEVATDVAQQIQRRIDGTASPSAPAPSEPQAPSGSLRCDGVVLLRRLPIDFRRVAEESGLARGKLCHSPHFGWGVQNSYGDPGPDFGCITPPAFEPGETELRIDCSEWWFLGPAAPAHQQENNPVSHDLSEAKDVAL